MPSYLTYPRLLLLAGLHAMALAPAFVQAQGQEIKWGPCGPDLAGTLPVLCGTMDVPLDYTEPDANATLQLELLKVPAVNKPCKGSILVNFGGPGISGRPDLAASAYNLQTLAGGYHDLVTFDPRGTGNTLRFSCYKTDEERREAQLKNPLGFSNASDVTLGRFWATGKLIADTCLANTKDFGSFLGTAFVARDMMRIVDALGEDGLLRYWGFSYGTVLGATVAAMFPDRMDKVVLDGVVNVHEYYHGYNVEMFTDSDKSFSGFFSGCVAAPKQCALARSNTTAAQLEEQFYQFLDDIKYNPIPFEGALIDYEQVKSAVLMCLYGPSLWPLLSLVLDGLMTGNMTAYAGLRDYLNDGPALVDDESNSGIKCSDNSARLGRLADLIPVVDALYSTSRAIGDATPNVLVQCAQWRMHARERYAGDFQVRTAEPVLIIGNTFDPLTPLVSARNVSADLERSVVLQHNGYGHSSIAQPSACTARAIAAYYVNGTLPDPGTVCEPDVPLFSNRTWDDVFEEMGLAPSAEQQRRDMVVPGVTTRDIAPWHMSAPDL